MIKDDYKNQLIALLPGGDIWPSDTTNNDAVLLIDALAEELSRIDARALNLVEEYYPNTTNEMLVEWETATGLPYDCTGQLDTLQQRRRAILGVLTIERSLSANYYIEVASRLGFDITISEISDFTWQVDAQLDTNAVYFRADESTADDPLIQSANNLLECVLNQLKPAHTEVVFNYV